MAFLTPIRGFFEKGKRAELRVCRIEMTGGVHLGTGCLIGRNLVLTCRHVIHDERKELRSPSLLQCCFSKTTSAVEEIAYAPGADGLDYAMLRLKKRFGGRLRWLSRIGWNQLLPI